MSKPNNANKGNYDASRNHQGEGVLNEQEKAQMGQEKARQHQQQEGSNESPASEKSQKH